MKIGISAARARDGHGKTNEFLTIKRADNLTADLCRDNEKPQRDQIDVVKIPDFFLQGDAGFEFADVLAGADDRCGRRHSVPFASCHNDSISSREAFSIFWPRSLSFVSKYWKRRRNLRLVFFNADSGSTAR